MNTPHPTPAVQVRSYDHLVALLRLPDAEFEAYWAHYLANVPKLVPGAAITLKREQLHTLQKIAWLAGREAAVAEITGTRLT